MSANESKASPLETIQVTEKATEAAVATTSEASSAAIKALTRAKTDVSETIKKRDATQSDSEHATVCPKESDADRRAIEFYQAAAEAAKSAQEQLTRMEAFATTAQKHATSVTAIAALIRKSLGAAKKRFKAAAGAGESDANDDVEVLSRELTPLTTKLEAATNKVVIANEAAQTHGLAISGLMADAEAARRGAEICRGEASRAEKRAMGSIKDAATAAYAALGEASSVANFVAQEVARIADRADDSANAAESSARDARQGTSDIRLARIEVEKSGNDDRSRAAAAAKRAIGASASALSHARRARAAAHKAGGEAMLASQAAATAKQIAVSAQELVNEAVSANTSAEGNAVVSLLVGLQKQAEGDANICNTAKQTCEECAAAAASSVGSAGRRTDNVTASVHLVNALAATAITARCSTRLSDGVLDCISAVAKAKRSVAAIDKARSVAMKRSDRARARVDTAAGVAQRNLVALAHKARGKVTRRMLAVAAFNGRAQAVAAAKTARKAVNRLSDPKFDDIVKALVCRTEEQLENMQSASVAVKAAVDTARGAADRAYNLQDDGNDGHGNTVVTSPIVSPASASATASATATAISSPRIGSGSFLDAEPIAENDSTTGSSHAPSSEQYVAALAALAETAREAAELAKNRASVEFAALSKVEEDVAMVARVIDNAINPHTPHAQATTASATRTPLYSRAAPMSMPPRRTDFSGFVPLSYIGYMAYSPYSMGKRFAYARMVRPGRGNKRSFVSKRQAPWWWAVPSQATSSLPMHHLPMALPHLAPALSPISFLGIPNVVTMSRYKRWKRSARSASTLCSKIASDCVRVLEARGYVGSTNAQFDMRWSAASPSVHRESQRTPIPTSAPATTSIVHGSTVNATAHPRRSGSAVHVPSLGASLDLQTLNGSTAGESLTARSLSTTFDAVSSPSPRSTLRLATPSKLSATSTPTQYTTPGMHTPMSAMSTVIRGVHVTSSAATESLKGKGKGKGSGAENGRSNKASSSTPIVSMQERMRLMHV